jgi:hypothetical protein
MWKFSTTREIFPARISFEIAAFPAIRQFGAGTRLAQGSGGGFMTTVHDFIHRHYSPAVGESPAGHAIAVLAGLLLIAVGAALVVSIVFVPAGLAIGVLGILIFGAGIFAHIMSPLSFSDLMDAVIGLSGAAITLTIILAIAAIAAGFGITVLVSLFRWLTS